MYVVIYKFIQLYVEDFIQICFLIFLISLILNLKLLLLKLFTLSWRLVLQI